MNCVDCLDRTNNCMGCFGSVIFLKQLELFGFNCDAFKEEDGVKNELLAILFEVYGINGDCIAKQYAGSEAFHKATLIETENGNWKTQKQNYTFLALKRYISNTLLDNEKQKNISLFLGDFLPNIKHTKHLWDLDLKELQENINLNVKNPFSNYQEKMNWWIGKEAINLKGVKSNSNRITVEVLEKFIKENDVFKTHLKLNNKEEKEKDKDKEYLKKYHINEKDDKNLFVSSIYDKDDMRNKKTLEEEIFQKINSTYNQYLVLEKNVIKIFVILENSN